MLTADASIKEFESPLTSSFNLELMDQAHWDLLTQIMQLSNFVAEINYSRYIPFQQKLFYGECQFQEINQIPLNNPSLLLHT